MLSLTALLMASGLSMTGVSAWTATRPTCERPRIRPDPPVARITSPKADRPTARVQADLAGKLWATLKKEDQQQKAAAAAMGRMTPEDETILFGDADHDDDPTSAKPMFASEHRIYDRFGNLLPDKGHPPNPLDHAVKDPLINKLRTVRETVPACPYLWLELAQYCPDRRALLDEHNSDTTINLTFAQMALKVRKSAAAFQSLGVQPGTHVAVLGENSAQWLLVDHGLQMAGGVSAVRGADAPVPELRYIYQHSDSAGLVVLQGPKLLQRMAQDAAKLGLRKLGLFNAALGEVKTVVLMHREKMAPEKIQNMAAAYGVTIHVLADLLEKVEPLPMDRLPSLTRKDLATIVYTSGTTGNPKGVMLTHGNLLHQTGHRFAPSRPVEEAEPLPGDISLALLPVWHITERTFELWMISHGCTVIYTNVRAFRNDLAKHQPHWLVLVPRVLEKIAAGVQDKVAKAGPVAQGLSKFFTASGLRAAHHRRVAHGIHLGEEPPHVFQRLYSQALITALAPVTVAGNKLVWSKVQEGFGGRLKAIIAGGSALAGKLDYFFETAGVPIIVGYGLTECSPLLTHRRGDRNLVAAGCAGLPCHDTEIRVVDPERPANGEGPRQALPDGQIGLIIARGPQVTQGYYKDPAATAKAIDAWGWFDTGDLGRINPATGDLILTGRAKDTIVLSNGENIEPQPIEDAILSTSDLIEQVMLTGQDGRRLLAIAVVSPSELGARGLLDADQAAKLQAANEKVNNPQCSEDDCSDSCVLLNRAAEALRKSIPLRDMLKADVDQATANFRSWEQVGEVFLTLEPFAMANGQLTQSYKVKRAAVMERYVKELPD